MCGGFGVVFFVNVFDLIWFWVVDVLLREENRRRGFFVVARRRFYRGVFVIFEYFCEMGLMFGVNVCVYVVMWLV